MATDAAAAAVALASLDEVGPGRLSALVKAFGFIGAWEAVCAGAVLDAPDVVRAMGSKAAAIAERWRRASAAIDPAERLEAHVAAEVDVILLGDDRYPSALAADLDPPTVLFCRGDLGTLWGPRVAIVGTRRCTRSGRLTALEMGTQLAEAGVAVVSGLALGIDGAAHQGALGAGGDVRVVGVVGTGLDVVYPRRHQQLWEAVATRGLLISEVPLGHGALPWRFPARNRIIAALAEVVVVVESHVAGGALHTVDEAIRRDRTVLAVPGSVRSPASTGTNALLHDGLGPARDAADVLVALGFSAVVPQDSAVGPAARGDQLDPVDAELLAHLGDVPMSVDRLATVSEIPLGELAVRLLGLEQRGHIARSGSWVERVRP